MKLRVGILAIDIDRISRNSTFSDRGVDSDDILHSYQFTTLDRLGQGQDSEESRSDNESTHDDQESEGK